MILFFANVHLIVTYLSSGSASYLKSGFLPLQLALDTAYIELVNGSELPLTINLQEFPYPPYKKDDFATDMFLYVLPTITIISFIFNCYSVAVSISADKYSGIRVNMQLLFK